MIRMYSYKLWNGKDAIGHLSFMIPLRGMFVAVPEYSVLKQPYNQKRRTIDLPIVYSVVSDDGVTVVTERVLDVRKKSARQRKILIDGKTI